MTASRLAIFLFLLVIKFGSVKSNYTTDNNVYGIMEYSVPDVDESDTKQSNRDIFERILKANNDKYNKEHHGATLDYRLLQNISNSGVNIRQNARNEILQAGLGTTPATTYQLSLPPSTANTVTTITTATNGTLSPLTLDGSWSRGSRLLIVLFLCVIGILMNGFFVTCFILNKELRVVGNVFLACLGLADMIICLPVMLTVWVLLLSGEWHTVEVCHALQFFVQVSTYCTSMLFAIIGVETQLRVFGTTTIYKRFISLNFIGVIFVILCVSIALSALGVYGVLDVDYCERIHTGSLSFRTVTGALFHFVPGITAFLLLSFSTFSIKSKPRYMPRYKRSEKLQQIDPQIIILNFGSYILYFVMWMPYIIISYCYPLSSDFKFYYSVWFALCRSVFMPMFYFLINPTFKKAFIQVFDYLCCKHKLANNITRRHRRAENRNNRELSVQVIQKVLNAGSPQRGDSPSQEMKVF